MITQAITFWGTVQGVGFRPTVARLAGAFGIKGQVRNMGGLVQLIVTDEAARIDEFVQLVIRRKPRAAEIVRVEREEIDTVLFHDFSIAKSSQMEDEIALIPADIALCDHCLTEFYDAKNPRFRHPFISCTTCGPRFTIMERLPYDRDTTTMEDFPMCGFCAGEYTDSDSARFHAQTISCHDCGPRPEWTHRADLLAAEELTHHTPSAPYPPVCPRDAEALACAISALKGGGLIALKGVGGYYFACSPYHGAAVQRLRHIKVREEKPFAVLFHNVEEIRAFCRIGPEEETLLTSPKRPIVLLEQRESVAAAFDGGVCNNSRFIGAFLPSFGLQYLLLDAVGPLIMTSANRSNLPIIKEDTEMFSLLKREEFIDGALFNRRRIVVAADDSVTRVIDGSPQLIRRSKGYTPIPVFVQGTNRLSKENQIFAAGGQLKSAFSFSKGSFVYLSQYLGDMDSIESEDLYREQFDRMTEFFSVKPTLAVCDMHPLYFTSRFAEAYADKGMKLLKVQHHHAHVASVMAEHGLAGPVIGVSFDGTGYGADGKIWGGEILVCEGDGFARYSHLRYVHMIGGDSSMKEGWKSAISYLASCNGSAEGEFDVDLSEIIAYSKRNGTLAAFPLEQARKAIAARVNTLETASMGRLFDGVAALLGIHFINRYEGECAIMLENAAARGMKQPGRSEADDLALRFHRDVAAAIQIQCRALRQALGLSRVALSGGVFQNKILMEMTLNLLRQDGFQVYYNVAVPPNDGGIALGQNYIGMQHLLRG